MEFIPLETAAPMVSEIPQIAISEPTLSPTSQPSPEISKDAIRTSLRASSLDAMFSAFYSTTTSGILLSNFLVELDASPVIFGMLSSIPMILNLIQPFGALLSERTTSRYQYCLRLFGPSRLLWLILVIGIAMASWGQVNSHQLVVLTLLIVLGSSVLGSLGSASWLSWMAMLVPRRLRGRYFGVRNSVASLTNLVCIPLAGLTVSTWPGGTLQGYGVVLFVGIVSGMISLGCQYFKIDVNPQEQNAYPIRSTLKKAVAIKDANNLGNTKNTHSGTVKSAPDSNAGEGILKNSNFLKFLLYFGFWMFAANLSLPFFNLYMLDTLNLDVSLVTLYGSLQAGANLLLLILWGKLADRIGNRPLLLLIGILASTVPVLWLGIGTNLIDLWLWLPLIHIFIGGNWAAIDLCNNNLQIEVAPFKKQSIYFASTAAIAGISGALGTTIGGFIAENDNFGGLQGLFVLSAALRLVAIVPLFFVQEPGRKSFNQMIKSLWLFRKNVAQS